MAMRTLGGRYQLVDIYRDTNAFVVPLGPFNTTERPFRRTVEGQPVWTVRQLSRFEAVLGSRGRSGSRPGSPQPSRPQG